LGETERDMVRVIQECVDLCIVPGLFAFTPITGTDLESCQPPQLEAYRRTQLARQLISTKRITFNDLSFDGNGCIESFGAERKELLKAIREGEAFRTSGCPDCNRPYYNEKPSGPIYNYPRQLTEKEIASIEEQLRSFFL